MGQTTTYQLPYPDSTSPRRADLQIKQLADRLELVLPTSGPTRPAVTYGTSPPGSPADGDLWYFPADATNGIIWAFRYRSGSGNAEKWEFVGGAPLQTFVGTQESTTTSSAFVNLATVGPRVTVPRSGVYLFSASVTVTHSATDGLVMLGAGIGDFSSQVVASVGHIALTGAFASLAFVGYPIALTSGQEFRLKYYKAAAGTLSVSNRALVAEPVRIS